MTFHSPRRRNVILFKVIMIDNELIEKLRSLKEYNGYTLHELSKKIDIQVSTLERWLRTGRINKVYANVVRERLGIK